MTCFGHGDLDHGHFVCVCFDVSLCVSGPVSTQTDGSEPWFIDILEPFQLERHVGKVIDILPISLLKYKYVI